MPPPLPGGVAGVLEPADAPEGVVLVDVAVAFPRAAAVAAGHDVQVAVAVDVRHLEAGHAVGGEAADRVRVPRVVDPLGLLQPGESAGGRADDVEAAVPVQIRVLQVEAGRPRAVDADGVLCEIEAAVAGILEEQQRFSPRVPTTMSRSPSPSRSTGSSFCGTL